MDKIRIRLKWLLPRKERDIQLPSYETSGSAGMDVQAAVRQNMIIAPGEIALVPTGFGVAIPPGYELQVRPRSGLAVKHGITLINSPGTIDSDYRGEVKIALINLGRESFTVRRGDRIAQLIAASVTPVEFEIVSELESTERGAGGFGHTGL
jgi:dUTP pyrophosphatase